MQNNTDKHYSVLFKIHSLYIKQDMFFLLVQAQLTQSCYLLGGGDGGKEKRQVIGIFWTLFWMNGHLYLSLIVHITAAELICFIHDGVLS